MKEKLEEAINDIYSIVHETILDYQEAGEDEDAAETLANLNLVKQFVEEALMKKCLEEEFEEGYSVVEKALREL